MRNNLLMSIILLLGIGVLLVNAIRADELSIRVLFSGLAIALFVYHVNRRPIGFRVDAPWAKTSVAWGLLLAVPFALYGLPLYW